MNNKMGLICMRRRPSIGQIIIIVAVPAVILATLLLSGLLSGNKTGSEDNDSIISEELLLTVPDVREYTEGEAKTVLEEFFSVSVNYVHDDTVEKDKVISQSLEFGAVAERGSEIIIKVSLGSVMVTVPDLIGMSREDAVSLLDEIGIKYFIEEVYHESAQSGTVCFQSISGGKSVKNDSRIKVNISKEKINIQNITIYSDTYVAIGNSVRMYYYVTPHNYQTNLIWLSDNTSVVIVENGVATGISEGTAVITVWSEEDESIYDSCTVTVFEDGIVVLTDDEIEKLVRMEARKPDGDIYKSDVYNMIFLGDYWVNLKARSLADLIYFPNVKDMWIHSEELNDLEPLIYCKKLEHLVIVGCTTYDIGVIAELTELKSLLIKDVEIINPKPIKKLAKLEDLRMINTGLNDISFLSGMTNLTYLSLDNNDIRYINAVSGLLNLTSLNLDNNKIKDITHLEGLKNLSHLWVENNRIRDLTPLSTSESLLLLEAGNNQIKDISPLTDCKIQYLYVRENIISDLTPLSGCVLLKTLDISQNNITDIDALSNCVNLYHLFLQGNKINDISSLYKISNLRYLYIWNTQICEEQINDFMQVNPDCMILEEKFDEVLY